MPSPWQSKFQPWPLEAELSQRVNEWQNSPSMRGHVVGSSPTTDNRFIKWLYESGFSGVTVNEGARERRRHLSIERSGIADYSAAAHANGTADSFAGQLVIPWVYQLAMFPGSEPGAGQDRGDCVSHAASGAERLAMCCDIASGIPDEKTGMVEGVPEVDPQGIADGITSSEWKYWWRGYNGDGWSCDVAAEVSMRHGIALRNNYSDLGIDLREYSGSLAGKYGSKSPPSAMDTFFNAHPIHAVADASSLAECRDALGNGHSIQSCGGEGFSSTRDQFGYSRRSGSWSHGYKNPGVDDRPEIKAKYGEPLLLNFNNWGTWNSGGRDIFDSAKLVPGLRAAIKKAVPWQAKTLEQLDIVNASTGSIQIPPGAWWCKWSEAKNRQFLVYSGALGWKRKNLPNWGGSLAG